MGLDMYLYKIKKIDGIGFKGIIELENEIQDLDATKPIPKQYNEIKDYIIKCGEHFSWYSLMKEIGYWRKANQIHAWMVENVQRGVDDCGTYYVSQKDVETLLKICETVKNNSEFIDGKVFNGYTIDKDGRHDIYVDGKIIKDSSFAEMLLPTQSGCFFGNTQYNEYYMEDIDSTIEILSKVLKETDFNEYYIAYSSSW